MRYMIALLLLTLSTVGNVYANTQFLDLIQTTKDAVVLIITTIPGVEVRTGRLPPGLGIPNEDAPEKLEPKDSYASGTGFIMGNGYIVTNHHVIEDASKIELYFENSRTPLVATVLAFDIETDIAVLTTKDRFPHDVTPLEWAAEPIRQGQDLWVIGHPNGFKYTVSKGIASHTDRRMFSAWQRLIQVDALIDHGNSGGPALNMDGEVIGISVAISSKVDTFAGIGLVIHHSIAESVVNRLIRFGEIVRPLMGVVIGYDLDAYKVRADFINEASPGAKAGILKNDLILLLDGHRISKINDVFDVLMTKKPGDTVNIVVDRDGKILTLSITFTKRPDVLIDSVVEEIPEPK